MGSKTKRIMNETLTKAAMADRLFEELGLNKREAKEIVELFFEEIRGSLERNEQVKLSGFGNFDLRDKKQRPGRNPKNTGDLVLTINGHGINTDEEISIAEGGITFTCAKDGHATNHPYPRSSDPAGGNTRLRVLYSDTNTIKVNVGTSSDTSTHTFVSATTNGVTHYDITNPYNGTNYEVATVPDAFTFTYSASGSVTVASPTGIPEYAIARYKNAGVRCGLFDFQNGFFYEYDGKQLYAVRRSSVQQLSGTVTAVYGRNAITGDGSSFTKDLAAGDFVVLRGQSYKVTSVVSDKILNIQPKYQGL